MGPRTHFAACEKWSVCLADVGNLRTCRRRISVGGEPLERAEYQAEQAWTTRKTVAIKELGTFGELSTSNPGAEVPEAGPEAPIVSARGADDVDMGDEVGSEGRQRRRIY